MMLNEILIRRKNKILLKKGVQDTPNKSYIVTIMKNIEVLGYTFSQDVYECLETYSKEELEQFYLDLIPVLKAQRGADVKYCPMYPNFPKSVMDEYENRLYMNAIVHYWSYGKLYPNVRKDQRLPLFEETKVSIMF